MAKRNIQKKDLIRLAVVAAGSIALVFGLRQADRAADSYAASKIPPAGEFTPGTYTHEAQGIGPVKVTMTFNETNITEVELDTSAETPEIGGVATEALREAIMTSQSPVIDAVAGATVTSDAVMAAAQACFNEASGIEPEAAEEPDAAAQADEAAPAEGDTAAGAEAAAPAEGENADTAAQDGAAEDAAAATGYTPGTYSAEAQGFGNVKVDVTLDESGITNLTIDASGETPEIGGAAVDTLKEQVLAANGTQIDGVAGATLTTTAVKTAIDEILASAGAGGTAAPAEAEADAAAEDAATAAGYTPGTYSAEAQGFGNVKVDVTLDESGITDLTIDASEETPEIGGAAVDTLKEQVLAANGTQIDGVAGATLTTTAVKTAVDEILAGAAGADAAVPAEAEAAADAAAPAETEENADAAAQDGAAETAAAGYTPGTYSAEAQGFGNVKVDVTLDESGITDLTIDASEETPEIGGAAVDTLKEQVLAANGTQIDGVAGATLTTTAVKTAVDEILAGAAGADTVASAEADANAAAPAEADADAAAPAEGEEAADTEEAATQDTAPAGAYIPGKYSAQAQGYGNVQVDLTLDENGITEIEIKAIAETPEIGGAAVDTLKEQVLAAKGAEIDGVAGATLTTTAVKTAVEEILTKAANQ